MTLKVDLRSRSTFIVCPFSLISHLDFPLGWDPSLPDQISLRGGIHCFHTKFLFRWDPGFLIQSCSSLSLIHPSFFLFIISPLRSLFLLKSLLQKDQPGSNMRQAQKVRAQRTSAGQVGQKLGHICQSFIMALFKVASCRDNVCYRNNLGPKKCHTTSCSNPNGAMVTTSIKCKEFLIYFYVRRKEEGVGK